MKLSSPDSPKPVDRKRILILGPPGGRKTTLCMSFPDVAFFDIDGNLDGPKLALSKVLKKEPTFGYVSVFRDKQGKHLEDYDCFDNLLEQIRDLKDDIKTGKCPFKFACFDGLRALGDLVKAQVLKKQTKDTMDTRDWDPYKQKMLKVVFYEAQNINLHTIFTCHEKEVWEAVMGRDGKPVQMQQKLAGYEPLLQGGIQQAFGGYFSDCWRVTSTLVGGSVMTKIQSIKDGYSPDLKSSIGMPPYIEYGEGETGWSKLESYFKNCL